MSRIATVSGSTRAVRHQFLDWDASASGLVASEHTGGGFPYPTFKIAPGGTTGGYAWRTWTAPAGLTSLVMRVMYESEPGFVHGSDATLIQLLNASDGIVAHIRILATNGTHHTQVRSGGALVSPYITGGSTLSRGGTEELWIAWRAATNGSTNDGAWLVWGGLGTYAIERAWLNNDGTSATEQVKKIRVGWLASGANPSVAPIHWHEVEVWDGQPTDLDAIYPAAGARFYEDTPGILAFTHPTGLAVDAVSYSQNGGAPVALTVRDVTGERTDAAGTSDAVNDTGELNCPSLFNSTDGDYDGCLVVGNYGPLALAPPSQVMWHRSAASNYKVYLHPIHPLCMTPPGKRGTLSTRTDDTTGVLTLNASHGVATGNTIHIYWSSGKRTGVTAGTVSGNDVPISGGTGDALPVATTAIYVAYNNASLAMVTTPKRFRIFNAAEWPAGSGQYLVALPASAMVAGPLAVTLTTGPTQSTIMVGVTTDTPSTMRVTRPKGKRLTFGLDDSTNPQFTLQRTVFASRAWKPYLATIIGGAGHKNSIPLSSLRLLRAAGWSIVPHFWDFTFMSNHVKAVALRLLRITMAALRMQGVADATWMYCPPGGGAAASDDANILDELLLLVRFCRSSTSPAVTNEPMNLTTAQLNTQALSNGEYNGPTETAEAELYLADKLAGAADDCLFSFSGHEIGPKYAATLTTRTSDTAGTLTIGNANHLLKTGNELCILWDGGHRWNVVAGTVSGTSVPFSGGTGDALPVETSAVLASLDSWTSPELINAVIDRGAALYGLIPTTLRNHMMQLQTSSTRDAGIGIGLGLG